MEKKTRQDQAAPRQRSKVSAKHFAISRSDADGVSSGSKTGITIQIRLKSPGPNKLVTRKNTEFWLSAGDE